MQLATRNALVPLLLFWAFPVLPAQVSATTPVSVVVADEATGAPLAQTRVEFPALGLSRSTDQLGAVYFSAVKSGVVRLKVSKIGYVPIERDFTLESPSAVELFVALKKIVVAQPLETVEVVGEETFGVLDDFERRRRLGLGRFLTAVQLDSSRHESLADHLARRVTGVRAVWTNSRMGVRLLSLRGPIRFRGQTQCFVRVYVDHAEVGADEMARIQSGDVVGVEYYSIAPPVQYNVNAPCGVLLVWTKP